MALAQPDLGDLIEIFHGPYQHWAVYVGDGLVVHLVPPSLSPSAVGYNMTSALREKAFVKEEKLWDVVGTKKWKINNSLDKECQPRCDRVIVKEARLLVGQQLPFNIFRFNCEHFANELRYGKAESRQVRQGVKAFKIKGAPTATVGLRLAALESGSSRENLNTE